MVYRQLTYESEFLVVSLLLGIYFKSLLRDNKWANGLDVASDFRLLFGCSVFWI